jgi:hypothetical protein
VERKLYLHIGLHKTGTTTIQKGLWENRKVLDEHGFYIPEKGRPYTDQAGHHNIAAEFGLDALYNSVHGGIDEVIKEISESKQENCILSSENFSSVFMEEANAIRFFNYIRPFFKEVTTIIYLRNPAKAVESLYAQILSDSCDIIYSLFSKEEIDIIANKPFKKFISSKIAAIIPALNIELLAKNIRIFSNKVLFKSFDNAIKKNLLKDFFESIEFNNNIEPIKSNNNNNNLNTRHSASLVGFTRRLLRYRIKNKLDNCVAINIDTLHKYVLGKPFKILDKELESYISEKSLVKYKRILEGHSSVDVFNNLFAKNPELTPPRRYFNKSELAEVHNQLAPYIVTRGIFLEKLCTETELAADARQNNEKIIGFYQVDCNIIPVKVCKAEAYYDRKIQLIIRNNLKKSLLLGKFTSDINIDSPKPGDLLRSKMLVQGWVKPSLSIPHLPRIIFKCGGHARSIELNVDRQDVIDHFCITGEPMGKLVRCGFSFELNGSDINSGVLIGVEVNGFSTYLVKLKTILN